MTRRRLPRLLRLFPVLSEVWVHVSQGMHHCFRNHYGNVVQYLNDSVGDPLCTTIGSPGGARRKGRGRGLPRVAIVLLGLLTRRCLLPLVSCCATLAAFLFLGRSSFLALYDMGTRTLPHIRKKHRKTLDVDIMVWAQGVNQSMRFIIPNSRGHTKTWESISPTQGATPKSGSPYPRHKGPHQSVEVCIPTPRAAPKSGSPYPRHKGPQQNAEVRIPDSRGHTQAWEPVSLTQVTTPKPGSPIPNSMGHTKAWESVFRNEWGAPKSGSPSSQFRGPHEKVVVSIPNSRGHIKAWVSISPTQGATPKRGSQNSELRRPQQSVGVSIPNSRGHTKAWE